jgi:hypothetical protein
LFSIKLRSIYVFVLSLNLFLLSGCLNQKTTPEKMYEVMEEVVIAESAFEMQQDPLVNAEKKEKQLYDEIISLGMKEYGQIVKLTDQALLLVKERETLMASESESIKKSKVKFEKLQPYIKELEEPVLKKAAKELFNVMMERYKLHDELQQSYSDALKLDKDLYQMLRNKDLSMDQLESQINQINEKYQQVYQINEKFNLNTKRYNELKLVFYKEAGFKIDNKI